MLIATVVVRADIFHNVYYTIMCHSFIHVKSLNKNMIINSKKKKWTKLRDLSGFEGNSTKAEKKNLNSQSN